MVHSGPEGAEGMAEDTEVEITIETLTGTVYELRISIFETFLGIKARIQRLEGDCSQRELTA